MTFSRRSTRYRFFAVTSAHMAAKCVPTCTFTPLSVLTSGMVDLGCGNGMREYEAAIEELEQENQLQMSRMMVEYERKLHEATVQKDIETQKRIDALSSRIGTDLVVVDRPRTYVNAGHAKRKEGTLKKAGADGEDTELVTSMSKVIAQKAAEMEMFKVPAT
eukprot:779061-Rhodomonas_salina.1